MTLESPLEPAARDCLERTRSAVLNVLIAVGLGIATTGLLIRWRDGWAAIRASDTVGRGLLGTLAGLLVLSVVIRRIGAGRESLRDPATRARRFLISHVASASVGALAVPLGLAYGWFVRPRLDAVLPFWVAALALGVLAFPRASALEGFEEPCPDSIGPIEPSS
ncbi:MAG: hypothetical protein AB7I30_15580 [Isosphaeraceae bacterium]